MLSVSLGAHALSILTNHQQKPTRESTTLALSLSPQVSPSSFSSSAMEPSPLGDGLLPVCYLPHHFPPTLIPPLDIIALLALGVLFILAFLFWQHYLEKRLDNHRLPPSRKFPPPIMRLSLWTRADGRFAVMQLIAFLTWCSFMSYNFWVQLFYQDYLRLSPVQTMLRLLPMFVTGVIWCVASLSSRTLNKTITINRQSTVTLSSLS